MNCRCCDYDKLFTYLDLGGANGQPLANAYHKGEVLDRYELKINLCLNCYHSQLSNVINPDKIYRNYLYLNSSKTLNIHFQNLAKDAVSRVSKSNPRVLDIASNSGELLEQFRDLNCEIQGVDPSINISEISKKKNIPVEVDYWSEKVAEKLGKFDVITATNVFAHVDNIQEFLLNCKNSLNPDGFVAIEFPYTLNLITQQQWDQFYHEHLNFYLVNSFSKISRRCNFQIFDVILSPVHGKSIRFLIRPSNDSDCQKVRDLIQQEKNEGLFDIKTYQDFAKKVNEIKEDFVKEIEHQTKIRKCISYGASAKGSTFLNYVNTKLEYCVDDNPMKHGYFTPGMDIPIVSPKILRNEPSDLAIVLLSWNFGKEIVKKIINLRPNRTNDCIMLYIPSVRVMLLPLSPQNEEILNEISG